MTLRRATWVLPAGRWPPDHETGRLTLAWDDRHRRRIRLTLDGGGDVLLDLAKPARLGEGDGLLLEDGGIVRIVAAPEPVLEIRAGTTSLARLAYHLGNRHLPIEILEDALVVRHDHVIAEMVGGLGGAVRVTERPFNPEAGPMAGILMVSMSTATDLDWLLPLTSWLSPSYPVGAYSYSHGLEWSVETGAVTDRASLVEYVATALELGSGWADLVLLAAAWRADDAALDEIVELATALRATSELAQETLQQGTAFVIATCAAWPGTGLDRLVQRVGKAIPYPVAVGAACAGLVPLDAALIGFGHAVAANLVSAGVRLIPLGQTDGQRALASLGPIVTAAAARAANTLLDQLGTAAPGIELASMRHETQYTRLFRS